MNLTGDFAYFDRGDSLMGDKLEGEDVDITKDDTAYELAVGGPIIKDKLFFYVTYSEAEIANPLRYGIQGSGAENILDVTADQAEQVRNAVLVINWKGSVWTYWCNRINSREYVYKIRLEHK